MRVGNEGFCRDGVRGARLRHAADHLRTPGETAAYLEACMEEAPGNAAFVAKALSNNPPRHGSGARIQEVRDASGRLKVEIADRR